MAGRFRSPLRGRWLTSVFGLTLLISLPFVIVTGLLDYLAYGPQFGQAFPRDVGWLHLPYVDWPTRPAWLFQLTQGLHVGLGLVLVPVILAKLWSVIPKLFEWPPARSIAHALERLSLLLLIGGILFEVGTGLLNIQYDYLFGFSFYTAHYYGAWVFLAAFAVHIGLKFRTMASALRTRQPKKKPEGATISRRGLLGLVAGGSLLVAAVTVGQSVDSLRWSAFLLPRGRSYGGGPTDFQVNRTARSVGITAESVGPAWRLRLSGRRQLTLDLPTLQRMPQHTAVLPIACVEGWSTTQTWTGVRLRDLAALTGLPAPANAFVQAVSKTGGFHQATLQENQVLDPDALLALRVNGAPLSLDHGFPARIIVPALPGVHCTKWVASIDFRER
ncbi:molybdopterin-dependent oxidoreductase [Fodinicola acaciae]|uniref:molybdopterin-dependent oxidoreductase n=1 Tax=Fodinicola acaciae TaxID=2681555 RepID=UPI0013D43058|nr:molybdopterin-dependent oxidoreductase [Fodinicola acaciae]